MWVKKSRFCCLVFEARESTFFGAVRGISLLPGKRTHHGKICIYNYRVSYKNFWITISFYCILKGTTQYPFPKIYFMSKCHIIDKNFRQNWGSTKGLIVLKLSLMPVFFSKLNGLSVLMGWKLQQNQNKPLSLYITVTTKGT